MIINPMIPLIIFIPFLVIMLLILYKTSNKINLIDIIIIILLLLVDIRPMIVNDDEKVLKNNLDILFVIDTSISMAANDYTNNETRLQGAQELSNRIIKELNGARFSLITFNSNSRILLPFINDATTTKETIEDILVQEEWTARGTTLNTPIEDIIKMLKSASKKENRKRILFFISDGEITNDDKLKSFEEIKEYVDNGAILGFGTEEGSTMLIKDRFTNKDEYIMDYTDGYKKAISKMDEENLKKIATDTDLEYIHVTNYKDCDSKLKEIRNIIKTQMTDEDATNTSDIYYLFTIPLFLSLLYKFYSFRRTLL